jgi:hypothetical protein
MRTPHRILAALALAAALAGCATPYQSLSWPLGGYEEVKTGEKSYMIQFRGNGVTSLTTANDFARLRAAELTLERGFRFFTIPTDQKLADSEQGAGIVAKPTVALAVQLFATREEAGPFAIDAAAEQRRLRAKHALDPAPASTAAAAPAEAAPPVAEAAAPPAAEASAPAATPPPAARKPAAARKPTARKKTK